MNLLMFSLPFITVVQTRLYYCAPTHNGYTIIHFCDNMEEAMDCWHAGLITILECVSTSQQIHVFTSQSSSSLHDVAAEADLLEKMHASGIIILHQACLAGTPCTASQDGVILQGDKGLVAPGVKLYPHRKKWQDASMRVYNEEEEDEEDA